MAVVRRTHTFLDNDILTASQLNAEFDNLLNALALVDADVSASAAIAYSKLNLTGAISNADINASAAIVATKISGTAAVLTGNTFTGKNTFAGTVQTITAYSPAGAGTATLDLSLGNIFTVNVPAGNITIALSNATTGQVFMIRFVNDTSVRTVTYFTTIKWDGGVAPTLSGGSKVDTFGFVITGSNTYDGHIVGQNAS